MGPSTSFYGLRSWVCRQVPRYPGGRGLYYISPCLVPCNLPIDVDICPSQWTMLWTPQVTFIEANRIQLFSSTRESMLVLCESKVLSSLKRSFCQPKFKTLIHSYLHGHLPLCPIHIWQRWIMYYSNNHSLFISIHIWQRWIMYYSNNHSLFISVWYLNASPRR